MASTLEVDLNYLGEIGGSSLTDFDRAVPTDAVEPPGIPSTYVPFRNTNLLAAAVAWAEVLGAEAVFIGANVLDNPGYPDCRPEYFEAFNRVIELGTRPETHLAIHTPLIHLDKGGIVRLGLKLGAPFELTWSCYQDEIPGLRPVLLLPPAPQGLRRRGPPRPHPLPVFAIILQAWPTKTVFQGLRAIIAAPARLERATLLQVSRRPAGRILPCGFDHAILGNHYNTDWGPAGTGACLNSLAVPRIPPPRHCS